MLVIVQEISDNNITLTNEEAIHLSKCLVEAAEEARDHKFVFPIGLIDTQINNDAELDKKSKKIALWIQPN